MHTGTTFENCEDTLCITEQQQVASLTALMLCPCQVLTSVLGQVVVCFVHSCGSRYWPRQGPIITSPLDKLGNYHLSWSCC